VDRQPAARFAHGIRGETIVDLGPWLISERSLARAGLFVIPIGARIRRRLLVQDTQIRAADCFLRRTNRRLARRHALRPEQEMPAWKIADILAPSIPLPCVWPHRCLMNGCCYGRACSLPWAIPFPGGPRDTRRPACNPTQIYESTLNLLLYAFLAWLYRRKNFDGESSATYLLGYAVLRAFVKRSAAITPLLSGRPRHTRPDSDLFIFAAGASLVVGVVRSKSGSPDSKP